ncbi:MAG TPA: class I SAM-dependent methyltransferase [Acidimicrobiales bacterium]|nr:class I SAM-dependent methyltransferase [Acidimicrobiales bacterium]
MQFFELDHPATQQHKVARAPGPGPTYVAADLTIENAAEALRGGGLDKGQPALFVLEGVTMYLPESVVRRQLAALADASAPGSRLTTDFYPPQDTGTSADQWQNRIQRLARTGSGEGLRLLIHRSKAVALVDACGWRVNDVMGMRNAARRHVPLACGLPVEAVNDHKTLVAGTRTSRPGKAECPLRRV